MNKIKKYKEFLTESTQEWIDMSNIEIERDNLNFTCTRGCAKIGNNSITLKIEGTLSDGGKKIGSMTVLREEEGNGSNDRTYTDYETKGVSDEFLEDNEDNLLELAVNVEGDKSVRKILLKDSLGEARSILSEAAGENTGPGVFEFSTKIKHVYVHFEGDDENSTEFQVDWRIEMNFGKTGIHWQAITVTGVKGSVTIIDDDGENETEKEKVEFDGPAPKGWTYESKVEFEDDGTCLPAEVEVHMKERKVILK